MRWGWASRPLQLQALEVDGAAWGIAPPSAAASTDELLEVEKVLSLRTFNSFFTVNLVYQVYNKNLLKVLRLRTFSNSRSCKKFSFSPTNMLNPSKDAE